MNALHSASPTQSSGISSDAVTHTSLSTNALASPSQSFISSTSSSFSVAPTLSAASRLPSSSAPTRSLTVGGARPAAPSGLSVQATSQTTASSVASISVTRKLSASSAASSSTTSTRPVVSASSAASPSATSLSATLARSVVVKSSAKELPSSAAVSLASSPSVRSVSNSAAASQPSGSASTAARTSAASHITSSSAPTLPIPVVSTRRAEANPLPLLLSSAASVTSASVPTSSAVMGSSPGGPPSNSPKDSSTPSSVPSSPAAQASPSDKDHDHPAPSASAPAASSSPSIAPQSNAVSESATHAASSSAPPASSAAAPSSAAPSRAASSPAASSPGASTSAAPAPAKSPSAAPSPASSGTSQGNAAKLPATSSSAVSPHASPLVSLLGAERSLASTPSPASSSTSAVAKASPSPSLSSSSPAPVSNSVSVSNAAQSEAEPTSTSQAPASPSGASSSAVAHSIQQGNAQTPTSTSTQTDKPETTLTSPIIISTTNAQGQITASIPPLITSVGVSTEPDGSFVSVTHIIANPTGIWSLDDNTKHGFFAHTGAVAGVFLVVGIVVTALIATGAWFLCKRRRRRYIRNSISRPLPYPQNPFEDPRESPSPSQMQYAPGSSGRNLLGGGLGLDTQAPPVPAQPHAVNLTPPRSNRSSFQLQNTLAGVGAGGHTFDPHRQSRQSRQSFGSVGVAVTSDVYVEPQTPRASSRISRVRPPSLTPSTPSIYPASLPEAESAVPPVSEKTEMQEPVPVPAVLPVFVKAEETHAPASDVAPPRPPRSPLRNASADLRQKLLLRTQMSQVFEVQGGKPYEPLTPPGSADRHSLVSSVSNPFMENGEHSGDSSQTSHSENFYTRNKFNPELRAAASVEWKP